MFRQMRRFKQALTSQECIEILKKEPRGVLSVIGENGYPYGARVLNNFKVIYVIYMLLYKGICKHTTFHRCCMFLYLPHKLWRFCGENKYLFFNYQIIQMSIKLFFEFLL